MGVARLFGAGLPGKILDEGRLALHQVLQAGLHGAEIVEGVHPLGARAEFAGRLGAAQEQDTENGDFVAIEVEGFLQAVLVLGDAAVRGADGADEGLLAQRMERLADGRFVEIRGGFPVRFLVASIDEAVQGERGIFRRDRKSTRLNSSHSQNSYAVFFLEKKKKNVYILSSRPVSCT